ncbi:MAG TPA: hypothetical protein VFW73_06590 [Lacipirellulaceae bacterium]|nr:hypothetical protein [Lacipirellulaceae bacterium]
MKICLASLAICLVAWCGEAHAQFTPNQIISSNSDIIGEAALKSPNGPSFEFFDDILPPLRYVDARYKQYPIVLAAPRSLVKGKVLSTGGIINPLARRYQWVGEAGIPWHVTLGPRHLPFGEDLTKLTGPHYADGYLPIVQLQYTSDDGTYRAECFAATDPQLAAVGAIFVRLEFPGKDRGRIDVEMESGTELLRGGAKQQLVLDSKKKVRAAYDDNFEWRAARSCLMSKEEHAAAAYIVVFTNPADASVIVSNRAQWYQQQREKCAKTWNDLLAAGTKVSVPEPYVNNAWRSLLVGTYMIYAGEELNYSAGNQYARKYAHESGESMRSLLLWGHEKDAADAIRPIFTYHRRNIEFHDGAFKLEGLAAYYFVTRDAELVRKLRPLWQREIDHIVKSRDPVTGLLPREHYCSDITTPVISINANANCWRGLRDMALVLEDMGGTEQAEKLLEVAADFRKVILKTIDKATDRSVDPPFLPIALGEETVHDPITSTRLGSYWNLVMPQVLFSGVFPAKSQTATDILRYVQTRGGLCMGMIRCQAARGAWAITQCIDDLYTTRYALELLERDEPDRALVTFYGKLAQGMTRDTFIDGETSGIVPLDRSGRQMGLPPNSTANASFLLQLRYLLVQDYDTDDDGRADTLRLCFATPRRWLEDGKEIVVEHAPTQFGDVSFRIKSDLKHHRATAEIDMPPRAPKHALLRLRLPKGNEIASCNVPSSGPETFELSGRTGRLTVVFEIK